MICDLLQCYYNDFRLAMYRRTQGPDGRENRHPELDSGSMEFVLVAPRTKSQRSLDKEPNPSFALMQNEAKYQVDSYPSVTHLLLNSTIICGTRFGCNATGITAVTQTILDL